MAGNRALENAQVTALARVTGNSDAALSMLYARAIESEWAKVSPTEVSAAERAIIATRFGGEKSAFRKALSAAHASPAIASALVADELRERKIAATLPVRSPSASAIKQYYEDQGGQLVRLVEVSPAPSWLGGKGKGYALASRAPRAVFRLGAGSERSVRTVLGSFQVTPIGPTTTLDSLSPAAARGAIRAALIESAREDAFAAWTVKQQLSGLGRTRCVRDQIPLASAEEPSDELPFLSLQDAG